MKIKALLFAFLFGAAHFGFSQNTETHNPVPVQASMNGELETHLYTFTTDVASGEKLTEVMKRYAKYLNYSMKEEDGKFILKVNAIDDPNNMLIMKRALVTLEVEELRLENKDVSIDEFYSKYSLR